MENEPTEAMTQSWLDEPDEQSKKRGWGKWYMSNSIAELKGLDPVTIDIAVENGIKSNSGSQTDLKSELTSYLSELGLGDGHLANVISLMQATGGQAIPAELLDDDSENTQPEPEIEAPPIEGISQANKPTPFSPGSAQTGGVTVFLAEEQQILLQAFKTFFEGQESVDLLGSSSDTSSEALIQAAKEMCPKVMLLGVKALRPSTVEILESLRDACPDIAIVLLFAFYDTKGIQALREFSRDMSVGRAYLLKHTVDTVEQLTHAISSVAEGRMIVDPMIMEELIKNGDSQSGMLRELSPRALEVLHWVSRGYRNETIAGVSSRDVKTVERHINNIYTTLLDSDDEAKHPRVRAADLPPFFVPAFMLVPWALGRSSRTKQPGVLAACNPVSCGA